MGSDGQHTQEQKVVKMKVPRWIRRLASLRICNKAEVDVYKSLYRNALLANNRYKKVYEHLELHPSRRWISTGCDLIDVNFVQVREIWEKPFTKKELKEVEWLDPQKDKESTHE